MNKRHYSLIGAGTRSKLHMRPLFENKLTWPTVFDIPDALQWIYVCRMRKTKTGGTTHRTPPPPSPSIDERWLNGMVWSLFSMDTSLYSNYEVHTYSRIHRTVGTILTKCCTQYIAVDSLHYSLCNVCRLYLIFYFIILVQCRNVDYIIWMMTDFHHSWKCVRAVRTTLDTWNVLQIELLKLCLVTEVICTY